MKLKHLITAMSIALLPVAAGAATFVVPAAGNADGVNASRWQSELTLHNAGPQALSVTVKYVFDKVSFGNAEITIPARGTKSVDDVVDTLFHMPGTVGALVIEVADRDAIRLAIASHTYNVSAEGEFGQDIPAVNVINAANAGDVNVLAAPSSVSDYRFNFGVFATTDANVRWEVLRADGTLAGSKEVSYKANQHAQYNAGIQNLIGVEPQDDDTLHAVVTSGRAIFYGSAINALTSDPTFVPPVRTRDEIRINFLGIDIDENGTIDIADADHDGVLDAPLEVTTSMFPSIFRVVAEGEFGEAVTLQIVDAPVGGAFLSASDTVQLGAPGDLKGTSGALHVRATAEGGSSVLTIPLRYR
jgi:hypothetical protein